MELTSNYFSNTDDNFSFWEYAKKKKKKPAKKGKGLGFLLAPLRPWRPFLAKGLQNMGVNVTRKGKGLKANWYLDGKKLSFGELVWLFAEVVIKGKKYDKQNFENFSLVMDSLECNDWDGTEYYDGTDDWDGTEYAQQQSEGAKAAGRGVDLAVKAATFDVAGLSTSLIQAIIDFIKKLRDKKKRGEKLTPVEEKLADAYDSTESEVIQNVKDEANEAVGGFILSPKTLILLAVVIAAIFIFRKKS